MNLYGLLPMVFGLIFAIKPDIRWLPILNIGTKKRGIGIRYRYINPNRTAYLFLIRITGMVAILLGLLVLFEIISIKGL